MYSPKKQNPPFSRRVHSVCSIAHKYIILIHKHVVAVDVKYYDKNSADKHILYTAAAVLRLCQWNDGGRVDNT